MDCENCRHLTVVGLHDTGPRPGLGLEPSRRENNRVTEGDVETLNGGRQEDNRGTMGRSQEGGKEWSAIYDNKFH